jgi:hypothetical protein
LFEQLKYICGKLYFLPILLEAKMKKDMSARTVQGAQDQDTLVHSIKTSLNIAKNKTSSVRRTNSQLFIANVISPAVATLLSGLAAAIGGNQMFQQAAIHSEDGGWRLACVLVAIFGFIATVSGMFKKQFDDRLTQGNQCVGRLLSLDMAITTGTSNRDSAAKEYGEIVKAFPEFVS